ncbi:PfkB family carbohydrate kinase, partial [Paenibacillus chitinolyticus]|uniref:PfkB family carbohydrate kinase n=1 Tax=Paenibacillus chitinolyticus TaxID=79263 RepID=UPI002DB7564B
RIGIPAIRAVNPVGSGDAMVAGMVTALRQGRSDADAARFGAACGSANALQMQAGVVTAEDVERIFRSVTVTDY